MAPANAAVKSKAGSDCTSSFNGNRRSWQPRARQEGLRKNSMNASIKCYLKHHTPGLNYFFVLNKGCNAGKPAYTPWTNCYIVRCSCPEERERLYYLAYALWKGGKFRPLLIGSVIESLRIVDLKHELQHAELRTHDCDDHFQKCVLQLIETENKIIRMQLTMKAHQQLQYKTLRCLLT